MRKGLRGAQTHCICDRCGYEKTTSGQGVLPEGWLVLRPEEYTPIGPKSREIEDLCRTCKERHDQWMKGDERTEPDK